MSKHTPGPWKYRGTLRTYIVEPVSSSSHVQRVAVVSKDIFAESQFNARLIAAAPDMLSALEEMVELAAPNIYPQPDKPNSSWAKLQRAKSALAKAKGAQPDAAAPTD